jgi:hypothetical protein
VALALDPVLKKIGGLLRPVFLIGLDPALRDWWLSQLVNALSVFLIGLDPALRGWWLSRLVNAFWLGVSSVPISGPTVGAPLLRRWQSFMLDSWGDGRLQQYNPLYTPCVIVYVYIPTLYRDVYQYK